MDVFDSTRCSLRTRPEPLDGVLVDKFRLIEEVLLKQRMDLTVPDRAEVTLREAIPAHEKGVPDGVVTIDCLGERIIKVNESGHETLDLVAVVVVEASEDLRVG